MNAIFVVKMIQNWRKKHERCSYFWRKEKNPQMLGNDTINEEVLDSVENSVEKKAFGIFYKQKKCKTEF